MLIERAEKEIIKNQRQITLASLSVIVTCKMGQKEKT